MKYENSGLYSVYIVMHLIKHGHLNNIYIEEEVSSIFCRALHDLIVRIGYNPDDNIVHLLSSNQWPF